MKLAWFSLFIGLGACAADPADISQKAAPLDTTCWEHVLPWGSGAGQVGLLPSAEERPARGPAAVAMSPDGEVLILDPLNRRVVALDRSGAARVAVSDIAQDAEDLAAGADGAVAVLSPLRSSTWLFNADGTPAGTLAIDRALRHVVGISLGASRQLVVRNAHQESYVAGSPAAPRDLATMLARKREGAFLTKDGRGVAVRVSDGRAELLLIRNGSGRAQAGTRYSLPRRLTAALLIGLQGDIACMRTERVNPDKSRITVERRVLCLDVRDGTVVHDQPLDSPGLYVPRQELALGGSAPPVLASIYPEKDGLRVSACEVLR